MAINEHPFDSLEQLHESTLDGLKLMFDSGTQLALTAAMDYCDRWVLPIPPWALKEAVRAQCAQLLGEVPKKRGRSNGVVTSHLRHSIDYVRWDTVTEVRANRKSLEDKFMELRELSGRAARARRAECEKLLRWAGTNDRNAFECASMMLRGSAARGGPDAVKKSFRTVERNLRDPATAMRYNILDYEFLRKIGAVVEPAAGQGKKIVSLFDLTI